MEKDTKTRNRKALIISIIIISILITLVAASVVVMHNNEINVKRGIVKFTFISYITNASLKVYVDDREIASVIINKGPNSSSASSSVYPYSFSNGNHLVAVEEANNNLAIQKDIIIEGQTHIITEIYEDKMIIYLE